jgi:6-phosphogluconate dehydrogenase
MKIGFAGLGRMGSQMVEKWLEDDHQIVVDSRHAENTNPLVTKGADSFTDYQDLLKKLGEKPIIWLMIQNNYVPEEVDKLLKVVPKGTIIVDGGNSRFNSTVEQGVKCAKKGVHFVDVGTSGGVWGIKQGFSMMVGGDEKAVEVISPMLDVLAKPEAAWHRFGKTGAGHFVKMVHNGIEYGVMQAFAEGYMLMHEGPFEDLDLGKVAEIWQHKSINESFLNSLIEIMLKRDPEFEGVGGTVGEKGEGRWTYETAQELGIDTPALAAALDVRRKSREDGPDWSTKFLAQLRTEFGGHNPNQKDART